MLLDTPRNRARTKGFGIEFSGHKGAIGNG
jgi:hypothetical protein